MSLRLLLFPLIALPAMAATVQFTASGTFESDVVSSTLVAPGANWQLTFTVEEKPAVYGVLPGFLFLVQDSQVSNVEYTLDGTEVPLPFLSLVFQSNGGFNFVFEDSPYHTAILMEGALISLHPPGAGAAPKLYAGPESAPTILGGHWGNLMWGSTAPPIVEGSLYDTVNSAGRLDITPEPATWSALAGGLVLLGFGRRRFERLRS